MLTWNDKAGTMALDGAVIGHGYSGLNAGKNNPALVAAVGIGPIPPGLWNLTAVKNSSETGPFTIVLEPAPKTVTHNRSAFRIHGDSIAHPGTASHGCIILPRSVRETIWNSGERTLTVV